MPTDDGPSGVSAWEFITFQRNRLFKRLQDSDFENDPTLGDVLTSIKSWKLITTGVTAFYLAVVSIITGTISGIGAGIDSAADLASGVLRLFVSLLASIPIELFGIEEPPEFVPEGLITPARVAGPAFGPLIEFAQKEPLLAFPIIVGGLAAMMFVGGRLITAAREAI